MQWMYPCESTQSMHSPNYTVSADVGAGGGMPQMDNRTKWPVDGCGVSVQPGCFPGHSKAFFYINIGVQHAGALAPPNMSHPATPPFQLTEPVNTEYDGQFCNPQIGMPANLSLQVGQNITIR